MNYLLELNLVLKLTKVFNAFYFNLLNILISVKYFRVQRSKATNSWFGKSPNTRASIIFAHSDTVINNRKKHIFGYPPITGKKFLEPSEFPKKNR